MTGKMPCSSCCKIFLTMQDGMDVIDCAAQDKRDAHADELSLSHADKHSLSHNTSIKTKFVHTAGVDTNSRLRVREEGNAGRKNGPKGDLYVFITVREHSDLKRDGTSIHSNIEVSYVDAILGTTVKVWLDNL